MSSKLQAGTQTQDWPKSPKNYPFLFCHLPKFLYVPFLQGFSIAVTSGGTLTGDSKWLSEVEPTGITQLTKSPDNSHQASTFSLSAQQSCSWEAVSTAADSVASGAQRPHSTPLLPLSSSVILGKLHHFSVSQFPQLYYRANIITHLRRLLWKTEITCTKCWFTVNPWDSSLPLLLTRTLQAPSVKNCGDFTAIQHASPQASQKLQPILNPAPSMTMRVLEARNQENLFQILKPKSYVSLSLSFILVGSLPAYYKYALEFFILEKKRRMSTPGPFYPPSPLCVSYRFSKAEFLSPLQFGYLHETALIKSSIALQLLNLMDVSSPYLTWPLCSIYHW